MSKIKKLRDDNVYDLDEIKRRKFNDKNCIDTNLEDLSNEILYEIFEYLDVLHIYQSFFDLNQRFQKLLMDFNLSIQINISSISKSVLQRYYTQIILPHQHQISSLCIINSFSFHLDISPHYILSRFIRLKTLILENIQSNYLDNIFQNIISLSNLSTLVIISIDNITNGNDLLLKIFHLPVLKYCKISLPNSFTGYNLLPFATNQYSTIEQLVIKQQIYHNNLPRLLSYVPQLRRLSFDDLWEDYSYKYNYSMTFNYLTHLFLNLTHLNFNEFELLIQHSFSSLQVLHLLIENGEEYLDAKRWEQLISSYIPSLRIFDIYCSYRYVRNSTLQFRHEYRLNQFTTSFWFQRQWFFTYEDFFKYGYHYIIFYSINPYRKKFYQFEKQPNTYNHLNNQDRNLSSVHHISILDEKAIIDCVNYFPKTTHLLLKDVTFRKNDSFISTLKYIVSLENLTKLVLKGDNYSFEIFIQLLSLTPNIDTLNIQSITLDRKSFLSIQNNETFQFVSNKNKIRNLTIKEINEMEEIKFLFKLFPQLQQFIIEGYWKHVKELIQLLLSPSSSSKHNINNHHLFLLCFENENKRLPNKLDTLIRGGKLLNDYFIKRDYPKIYLWW